MSEKVVAWLELEALEVLEKVLARLELQELELLEKVFWPGAAGAGVARGSFAWLKVQELELLGNVFAGLELQELELLEKVLAGLFPNLSCFESPTHPTTHLPPTLTNKAVAAGQRFTVAWRFQEDVGGG